MNTMEAELHCDTVEMWLTLVVWLECGEDYGFHFYPTFHPVGFSYSMLALSTEIRLETCFIYQ
jgi:hypothetical protein